jgi:hypothetical protein
MKTCAFCNRRFPGSDYGDFCCVACNLNYLKAKEKENAVTVKKYLLEDDKAKYVDDDGRHCPYCGSGELIGSMKDAIMMDEYIHYNVNCKTCKIHWVEVYKLFTILEGASDETN